MPHQILPGESAPQHERMFCLVMITAASQAEAKALAHALVENHLAACVSMTEVQSVYRWNNTICDDSEWQLLAKTDQSKFAELEKTITCMHSYDLPEIIALPIIQGYKPYLKWIAQEVGLEES